VLQDRIVSYDSARAEEQRMKRKMPFLDLSAGVFIGSARLMLSRATKRLSGECNYDANVPLREHIMLYLMKIRLWLKLAAHPATVRRAFLTSMMVGTVLIAINHGNAIITGTVTPERVAQMLLTVVVPYVVSTVSSVATRNELLANIPASSPPRGMHRPRSNRIPAGEFLVDTEACN
jgi:hypothetical protein